MSTLKRKAKRTTTVPKEAITLHDADAIANADLYGRTEDVEEMQSDVLWRDLAKMKQERDDALKECGEFCDCKCHKPEPTRAPESAEVDVIDTGLAGAVRQYRHNNGDGFVMGYDRNVVHEVIGRLESYTKDCNRDLGKVYDENQALTKERDDALAEVERLKDENEQLGYELKEAANS